MRMRRLGSTGIEVTDICLGTMQFGWTADEGSSFAVLDAYVAAGGNFIDTADVYSRWSPGNPGGVSEEIIGRWMKARGNRGSIVLATKVRAPMWEGADGEGLGRAHVMRAVEDSLRRLQVETIDLYQCHWPDDQTPIEETLGVFGELVASGKVRQVGASNFTSDHLADALRASRDRRLPAFVSLQPHYNLVHRREYEDALAALCAREGIAVIPYSPLAGGFLTGKYRKGAPLPESARAERNERHMSDQGFAVVGALEDIAAAHGTTIPAIAIAWLLGQPGVTSPIVGANTPEQLAALLPASDVRLSAAEAERLAAVSSGL